MVLTFRAGKFAVLTASVTVVLAGLAACSREQQDWRSAEASDTVEAYSDFLKDHPESGLVRQARARLTQLSEDRAWSQAGSADTVEAYKQFLTQYPNGKWSQEAHIRVENFELGAAGSGSGSGVAASNAIGAGAAPGSTGFGGTPAGPSPGALAQAPAEPTSTQSSVASARPSGPVAAGEAAQLPTSPNAALVQSPRPSTYPVAAAAPFPSASSATNASGIAAGPAGPSASNIANASVGTASPGLAASSASAYVGTASAGLAASAPAGLAASAAPAGVAPSASTTPSSISAAWRSADPTSYGVQLGAFASENAASSQWQQLVERFNAQLRGLAPHVVSAETATGRLFRLQALVADEATARALCDMLRKQSQACVPVLPH